MKIFIGGASEDSEQLREIESWVQEQNYEAWPWDKPGTFTIGVTTFTRLIEISKQIEAAIIVFSPADLVYYRGDAAGQPRDNVLIEYGLFASALGPERCAIAIVGDSKIATDLAGISTLDFRGNKKARGRIELGLWLQSLSKNNSGTGGGMVGGEWEVTFEGVEVVAATLEFNQTGTKIVGHSKVSKNRRGEKVDRSYAYLGSFLSNSIVLTFEDTQNPGSMGGAMVFHNADSDGQSFKGKSIYFKPEDNDVAVTNAILRRKQV